LCVILQGAASAEDALDWLCLNLPQAELPKRFAGGVRAGGAVSQVTMGACDAAEGWHPACVWLWLGCWAPYMRGCACSGCGLRCNHGFSPHKPRAALPAKLWLPLGARS